MPEARDFGVHIDSHHPDEKEIIVTADEYRFEAGRLIFLMQGEIRVTFNFDRVLYFFMRDKEHADV